MMLMHKLEVMMYNRIVVVDGGEVREQGTYNELMKHKLSTAHPPLFERGFYATPRQVLKITFWIRMILSRFVTL